MHNIINFICAGQVLKALNLIIKSKPCR